MAGFIGSPAMNFVPGGLLEGAGEPGRIVGFRPEHVEVGDLGGDAVRFRAKVEVVEYLGDELLVHFTVADRTLLAKVPVEHRLAPGDEVGFSVAREKLHLFDAETEEAVPAR